MNKNSQIASLFKKNETKKIASFSTPLVIDDQETADGVCFE
jgi:hypothetical protein